MEKQLSFYLRIQGDAHIPTPKNLSLAALGQSSILQERARLLAAKQKVKIK
jgi:predicted metalloprotease